MSEHDEREDYDDLPNRGPLAPEYIVRRPAAMMWGVGLVQLIITQLAAFFYVALMVVFIFDGETTLGDTSEIVLGIAGWVAASVWLVTVMRAASKLRRFQSHRWVVTGAMLTLLTMPPVGIWLVWLLLRRDVRARFEAVARGTKLAN